jgi:hypothetical protein
VRFRVVERVMPRQGSRASNLSVSRQKPTTEPSEEIRAFLRTAQKPRKYRNVKVTVDGITFDSKAEVARYHELRQAQEVGAIHDLEVHPRFPLVIHGIDTGDYVADFRYVTAEGVPTVEDVKSTVTRKLGTYQLKRKQVWALYAIEIREVL